MDSKFLPGRAEDNEAEPERDRERSKREDDESRSSTLNSMETLRDWLRRPIRHESG